MSQRLTITLDDEIYSRLKKQAERDYRTIGAEICYLLQLHVPDYTQISKSESHPYSSLFNKTKIG